MLGVIGTAGGRVRQRETAPRMGGDQGTATVSRRRRSAFSSETRSKTPDASVAPRMSHGHIVRASRAKRCRQTTETDAGLRRPVPGTGPVGTRRGRPISIWRR